MCYNHSVNRSKKVIIGGAVALVLALIVIGGYFNFGILGIFWQKILPIDEPQPAGGLDAANFNAPAMSGEALLPEDLENFSAPAGDSEETAGQTPQDLLEKFSAPAQ